MFYSLINLYLDVNFSRKRVSVRCCLSFVLLWFVSFLLCRTFLWFFIVLLLTYFISLSCFLSLTQDNEKLVHCITFISLRTPSLYWIAAFDFEHKHFLYDIHFFQAINGQKIFLKDANQGVQNLKWNFLIKYKGV